MRLLRTSALPAGCAWRLLSLLLMLKPLIGFVVLVHSTGAQGRHLLVVPIPVARPRVGRAMHAAEVDRRPLLLVIGLGSGLAHCTAVTLYYRSRRLEVRVLAVRL